MSLQHCCSIDGYPFRLYERNYSRRTSSAKSGAEVRETNGCRKSSRKDEQTHQRIDGHLSECVTERTARETHTETVTFDRETCCAEDSSIKMADTRRLERGATSLPINGGLSSVCGSVDCDYLSVSR